MQGDVNELDYAIVSDIFELTEIARQLMVSGNRKEAEECMQKAWRLLPDPKFQWNASEALVDEQARFYRDLGEFKLSRDWASKLVSECGMSNENPGFTFLLGTIAYEEGKFDEARLYLGKAYEKSKGRHFQGYDPKYLRFVKNK